jgi:hypothetical protein
VNELAGRAIAGVGVALAFACIWIDALPGNSYWSGDGTTGAFVLALAILALLGLAVGGANDLLLAAGGILLGFYLFIPVAFAFDHLDVPEAGTWLALSAGVLIVAGVVLTALTGREARETPAGLSRTALLTALGIVLVFPGIFVDATTDGDSYWSSVGIGHSLGICLLVVAALSGAAWAARVAGFPLRGLDWPVMLVMLGFVSFFPVGAAFGEFGTLDAGAWLAFSGGILAAGGVWAARGTELQPAKAVAA